MRRLLWLGYALLVMLLIVQTAPGDDPADPKVRLLVPAYFYPSGDGLKDWKRLIASSSKVPLAAIVNPDSGPGKKVDGNYREAIRLAKGSQITLIGYVTLSYAERPLSAVKADVDSWVFFYPDIQGIFFDEQPSKPEQAGFAKEAFEYAQKKIDKATVVTNPGIICDKEFLSGKSPPVACLFEHEKGFEEFRLPEWALRLGADRFAVLGHNVKNAAKMKAMMKEAADKGTGWMFFTDEAMPMPWGKLPLYWEEEVAEALRLNGLPRSKE